MSISISHAETTPIYCQRDINAHLVKATFFNGLTLAPVE